MTEENNRLRLALDARRASLENTQTLIQEGEAKIEHWKVGLENSYQQKRILKQSMRQLMEEDAALREAESFLDRVYKGSVSLLVSALTQKQALSRREIDELYAILQQAEKEAEDNDP